MTFGQGIAIGCIWLAVAVIGWKEPIVAVLISFLAVFATIAICE